MSEQKSLLREEKRKRSSGNSDLSNGTLAVLTALVIVALGLSAGLGGAAFDKAKKATGLLFNAGGRVLTSGSNAQILVSCINDTGAATSGYAKIEKGDNLTFYSPCPTPRTTCEVSFCGTSGICETQLAAGKECAGNVDCTAVFGSNSYCNTTSCTCVNGTASANTTICCDWIDFTPVVTAVNLTLDGSQSWYQYRPSGSPPAHIEFEGQFLIETSAGSELDYTIVFDISSTGFVLDSSGDYNGFAVFKALSAENFASRIAATSGSNATLFFSKSSATQIIGTYVNFVFHANLQ